MCPTVALRYLKPDSHTGGMAGAQSLGLRIKRARERLRWSQRQLADAIGVSVKTIDNYENNRTVPRSSIGALEDVLGIDLSSEEQPAADPLADLLPPRDEWEQQVFDNRDLPDEIKRRFIEDWRRARSDAQARRQPRQNGAPATAAG